jgi:hypothetical protein
MRESRWYLFNGVRGCIAAIAILAGTTLVIAACTAGGDTTESPPAGATTESPTSGDSSEFPTGRFVRDGNRYYQALG